jgi:hypothetical protein
MRSQLTAEQQAKLALEDQLTSEMQVSNAISACLVCELPLHTGNHSVAYGTMNYFNLFGIRFSVPSPAWFASVPMYLSVFRIQDPRRVFLHRLDS